MSRAWLLDVNVLIAMAWPSHEGHARVQQWLARHAREGWATCPLTESAFVRNLSNPAFSPHALTPLDALALLRANLDHPQHQFWGVEISLAEAVTPFGQKLIGHHQVADAYLLGLAIHKQGKFTTMDRGILALLGEKNPERARVALL
jgi:uncharacterized protein